VPRGMSTVINNLGVSSLLTNYGSTNYQHQKTTLSGIGAQNIMLNLRNNNSKEKYNTAPD
jgi:hypothetical protein